MPPFFLLSSFFHGERNTNNTHNTLHDTAFTHTHTPPTMTECLEFLDVFLAEDAHQLLDQAIKLQMVDEAMVSVCDGYAKIAIHTISIYT